RADEHATQRCIAWNREVESRVTGEARTSWRMARNLIAGARRNRQSRQRIGMQLAPRCKRQRCANERWIRAQDEQANRVGQETRSLQREVGVATRRVQIHEQDMKAARRSVATESDRSDVRMFEQIAVAAPLGCL